MPQEIHGYSNSVSRDDLEAARMVLHQSCICQSQAFEIASERFIGVRNCGKSLPLVATLFCAIAFMILAIAAAVSADILWSVVFIILTIVFVGAFVAQLVWGVDRIRAAIRNRFTDPLIRSTVNLSINSSLKRAPFSVTYRFTDSSYSASVPDLKFERTIRSDEITVAYYANSVFCLFRNNRSSWKGIIYAPLDEHSKIVREFLKRNQVEVRELTSDQLAPEHLVTEADLEIADQQ